jgi:uncharacterized protein (TIGR03435 family)
MKIMKKPRINKAKLICLVAFVFSCLLIGFPTCAQVKTGNEGSPATLAFEVASIRPVDSNSFAPIVTINFEPDRYVASNCSLKMLIKEAYGVDDYQIIGGSEWINSIRYEIEARIDSDTYEKLRSLSYDQLKLSHRRMVQTLLADRFKLKLHSETKTLPIYSLTAAKNGPTLHKAEPGKTYAGGALDPSGRAIGPHRVGNRSSLNSEGTEWAAVLTGQAASLDDLAKAVGVYLNRPIVDNTGLTGEYDFQINFNWPFDGGEEAKQHPDSLIEAFQNQLGLKLDPRKGRAEVLVIDHIEKPSEN